MPPNPFEQAHIDGMKAESNARIVVASEDAAAFRKQLLELAEFAHERDEKRKDQAHVAEEKRKDEQSQTRIQLAMAANACEEKRKKEADEKEERRKDKAHEGEEKKEETKLMRGRFLEPLGLWERKLTLMTCDNY